MRSIQGATLLVLGGFMVIAAELEQPFPASNCNSGIAGLELSCPNQPGCCSGGALCCAGGCCALTATCVNIGQADEGCCDALDPTLCGTVAPNSASPPEACGGFKASKTCVGASGSWSCPAEDGCDLMNRSCIPFPKPSCTVSGGSSDGVSSSAPAGSAGSSASSSSSSGASSSGGGGSSSDSAGQRLHIPKWLVVTWAIATIGPRF